MSFTAIQVGVGLWAVFVVSWMVSAMWTARAVSRGSAGLRIGYLAGFILGFGLLFAISPALLGAGSRLRIGFGPFMPAVWQRPLWHAPAAVAWGLVAIEGLSFAFAWYARAHLGRLWSGMLTLREGHRVVDTGPYRLARHPIYTGYIAASWALALAVAGSASLAGAAILTVVMALKALSEETLLRRELSPAAYDDYARRTPMLIPFAPR